MFRNRSMQPSVGSFDSNPCVSTQHYSTHRATAHSPTKYKYSIVSWTTYASFRETREAEEVTRSGGKSREDDDYDGDARTTSAVATVPRTRRGHDVSSVTKSSDCVPRRRSFGAVRGAPDEDPCTAGRAICCGARGTLSAKYSAVGTRYDLDEPLLFGRQW